MGRDMCEQWRGWCRQGALGRAFPAFLTAQPSLANTPGSVLAANPAPLRNGTTGLCRNSEAISQCVRCTRSFRTLAISAENARPSPSTARISAPPWRGSVSWRSTTGTLCLSAVRISSWQKGRWRTPEVRRTTSAALPRTPSTIPSSVGLLSWSNLQRDAQEGVLLKLVVNGTGGGKGRREKPPPHHICRPGQRARRASLSRRLWSPPFACMWDRKQCQRFPSGSLGSVIWTKAPSAFSYAGSSRGA